MTLTMFVTWIVIAVVTGLAAGIVKPGGHGTKADILLAVAGSGLASGGAAGTRESKGLEERVATAEIGVTWQLQFYSERRHAVARYEVQAPTAAAADALGRKALRAEHPSPAAKRQHSLFERARRRGAEDDDGWVLYRIGRLPDAADSRPK